MKTECDRKCQSCDLSQRSFCSTQMCMKIQDMLSDLLSKVEKVTQESQPIIPMMDNVNKDEEETE